MTYQYTDIKRFFRRLFMTRGQRIGERIQELHQSIIDEALNNAIVKEIIERDGIKFELRRFKKFEATEDKPNENTIPY